VAHASLPTRHGGSLAKNVKTCLRRSERRTLTAPAASTARTWKTRLAKSSPIVVTCSMDDSRPLVGDTQLWHNRCREGAIHPIRLRPVPMAEMGPGLRVCEEIRDWLDQSHRILPPRLRG